MTTLPAVRSPTAAPRRRPRVAVATVARPLNLLTFNIGAAALERGSQIARWLLSRDDDVIVLTETSSGPGTALIADRLGQAGYGVRQLVVPGERGVLLASRVPVAQDLTDDLAVTLPSRVRGVVLATSPAPIAIVGVYVPSRDRSDVKIARKQAFIGSLTAALVRLPAAQRRRLVMVGDYNVVADGHEPRLPGFFRWEYDFHDELARLGLRPAHEVKDAPHPHSWIGRTGLRYLYDYVHVGEDLHAGVDRCEYLHGPRERRLSDHAAVHARLRLA